MKKVVHRLVLVVGMMLVLAIVGALTAIAAEEVHIRTDVEIAGDLGLLIGDGDGLTDEYLAKSTTRLQAAIMFLRLKGLQDEAFAFTGTDNFADAELVGAANQAVLAYLKAQQELGWAGVGENKFDPSSTVTAQQFYKVILEALGYKTGTDFEYKDTISFAASKGLTKVAANGEFVNADIATATVEALKATIMGSDQTLADRLVDEKVIEASDASVVSDARVDVAMSSSLGSYLADGEGMTLYYFTKDAADVNSCTGNCLVNWPIFYSENLQIGASLNETDFGVLVRADGSKQLTYKSWPLYYYVKDLKAGDTLGENVGTVWFVIDPDKDYGATSLAPRVEIEISDTLGNYLVDGEGMTLYYFTKDAADINSCTGNCLVNWPIFYSENLQIGEGLNEADFGQFVRADGSKQLTYKSWPLYYYVKDLKAGDTLGENVGTVWFVIDPADDNGTTSLAATKTYQIEMKNYAFSSPTLTIEVGSSVTFTNMDTAAHNAVAVDGSFETVLLNNGESATVTFDKVGVYDYYCEPHKSHMTAQIIVK